MLISTAYAQGTGLSGLFDNQSALIQFLPLVLIFVVFYFLLIRPQQRKARDHRATLDALRRGDRVVTGGGIIGTVVRVDSPDEVVVDIADGVRVRVVRSTITSVACQARPGRRARGGQTEGTGAGQGRHQGVTVGDGNRARWPMPEIRSKRFAGPMRRYRPAVAIPAETEYRSA